MHAGFGLCAAVVLVFKMVLVVVPLSMWLVWVGYSLASGARPLRRLATRMLSPALAGAALPLAAVGLYFTTTGTLDIFLWTTFEYPQLALAEFAGREWPQWFVNARWWLLLALPVGVLVALNLQDLRREPLRLIEAQALAWLLAGIAAIVVQKFSWWTYHFLLLLPPTGLIAASVIDRHGAAARRSPDAPAPRGCLGRMAIVVLAMFALTPLHSWRSVNAGLRALAAPGGERLASFRAAFDPGYRERIDETRFLRDNAADAGAIYVFGNPNWLLQAGRAQALPIHGWAWEYMLTRQWDALPATLREARPAYLYIDAAYGPDLTHRSPATMAFIRDAYETVLKTREGGTWHRLKPGP